MLTNEQKELMESILSTNTAVLNDRHGIDIIEEFNPNEGSFDIKNDNVGSFEQTVIIAYPQVQPISISFYTKNLITGYGAEALEASRQALDDIEQSGITDKLTELKNII